LDSDDVVVEFGLLINPEQGEVIPYLIDTVNTRSSANLNLTTVTKGVISSGIVEGVLIPLKLDNSNNQSLGVHFHDQVHFFSGTQEGRIFVCDYPDISLLEVLKTCDPKRTGFIFGRASILSHFPIVLREQGIPAIEFDWLTKLPFGKKVRLDAASQDLTGWDRIKYI
jgi:hypothetical protein